MHPSGANFPGKSKFAPKESSSVQGYDLAVPRYNHTPVVGAQGWKAAAQEKGVSLPPAVFTDREQFAISPSQQSTHVLLMHI